MTFDRITNPFVVLSPSRTALETCLKYSENPEQLEYLLGCFEVAVCSQGIDYYFPDDKQKRIKFLVRIKREGKEIFFDYGGSIKDTEILQGWDKSAKRQFWSELLYSLLCCIKCDYFVDDTFDDFCDNFGYDTDSRKAFDLWNRCTEQAHKLQTIFTEQEIECFPS